MNIPFVGPLLLYGILMLLAATVRAEATSLALTDAIKLAVQNQPLLQSLDDASQAYREAAVAAGQLPDPKVRLGVINLPITGGDTGRFNRDDMTMSAIGIMQEVVPSTKREAASRIYDSSAQQFQSEKAATTRTIERDVALAWLDVYEAQHRSALYERIAQEFTSERKALTAKISSGGAKPGEVLKLDSQLSMSYDKRLTVQRDEKKARAQLARWIGTSANLPLSAELPVMTANYSEATAPAELEKHPILQNALQMESVALSEADRARAERALNWSWEVMYGKRRSDLSDMVTFQVSMDLPWDRANRQDKRTAEKLLLVERARKLTEDRRRELNAELQNALSELETAEAREKEHQERLIPAAQGRVQLSQASYAAGKQNLSEVWEARRALIDVEIEHWTILADKQRAAVRLGYLLNDSRLYQGAQP